MTDLIHMPHFLRHLDHTAWSTEDTLYVTRACTEEKFDLVKKQISVSVDH